MGEVPSSRRRRYPILVYWFIRMPIHEFKISRIGMRFFIGGIMGNIVYKIKDSVDLFLNDDDLLIAQFMNSRRRKMFKISDEIARLLEMIDGEKNNEELFSGLQGLNVPKQDIQLALEMLKQAGIIAQVSPEHVLSNAERERYTRQLNYFGEFLDGELQAEIAQKKLQESKILIFGIGSVGGDIALELARAGVEHYILFDYDVVEKSDVSRHMYYRIENVGQYKTEALAQELKRINKNVVVNQVVEALNPTTDIEELIKNADFIVNTADKPYIGYTSAKISRLSVLNNKPHFIAGGFDAHLASTGEIIIPYVTPCVECYTGYFKQKLANWKPKQHPVASREKHIGGLAAMSLFSASYAACEIIKFITDIVDENEEYKIRGELLFNSLKLTHLDVKRNPDCIVCGGESHE